MDHELYDDELSDELIDELNAELKQIVKKFGMEDVLRELIGHIPNKTGGCLCIINDFENAILEQSLANNIDK